MARLLHAALIALAATLIAAPSASATVSVAADGTTLGVVSSDTGGTNDVNIGFANNLVTFSSPQTIDLDPSADPACDFATAYEIDCNPTGFTSLEGDLAGANDNVTSAVCFPTELFFLGNGTNSYHGPACDNTAIR